MRDFVILSGSSHPGLVNQICSKLAIAPGQLDAAKFSNGETSVTISGSVREKDVYVVQSGCGHVNDNLMELLILISACKIASASSVTAVLPYFPYSRQSDVPFSKRGSPQQQLVQSNKCGDPSSSRLQPNAECSHSNQDVCFSPTEHNTGYRQWAAQAGTLVASLLEAAGADHIVTMDLHDPQFQGFFDIPVDNLYSRPLFQHYIAANIPNYQDAVIVSPDAGGAKRATSIADSLGMLFALIHKERNAMRLANYGPSSDGSNPAGLGHHSAPHSVVQSPATLEGLDSAESCRTRSNSNPASHHNYPETTMLVGDVRDRVAILVDDLVDTGGTITRAAKLLKDHGATKVYAIATHGLFAGDAVNRIRRSCIDRMVVTNSTPQEEHLRQLGSQLDVIDVSRVLGEAIRRIHNGESVSMSFDHVGL